MDYRSFLPFGIAAYSDDLRSINAAYDMLGYYVLFNWEYLHEGHGSAGLGDLNYPANGVRIQRHLY